MIHSGSGRDYCQGLLNFASKKDVGGDLAGIACSKIEPFAVDESVHIL